MEVVRHPNKELSYKQIREIVAHTYTWKSKIDEVTASISEKGFYVEKGWDQCYLYYIKQDYSFLAHSHLGGIGFINRLIDLIWSSYEQYLKVAIDWGIDLDKFVDRVLYWGFDYDELETYKLLKSSYSRSKIKDLAKNEYNIIKALYSINKEAKRLRDIQRTWASLIYDSYYDLPLFHWNLHRAKNKKEDLYNLKSKILHLLYDKKIIELTGYHWVEDNWGDKIFYVMFDYPDSPFTFHSPVEEFLSEDDLDLYEDLGELQEISSERKYRTFPAFKAELILKEYLNFYNN